MTRMTTTTTLVAILLGIVSATAFASSAGFNVCWTYDCNTTDLAGLHPPEEWSECAPTCGGSMQSPINVELISVHQTTTMQPITFTYILGTATVHNEGPSITVHIPISKNYLMTDGFGDTYFLDNMHLHWAKSGVYGSEHAIAGRREAVEAHLVHYSTKYANLSHALSSGQLGAVSVIAVMLKIGALPNVELAKILAHIDALRYPITEAEKANDTATLEVAAFDPRVLLTKGADALDYLYYNGSLTTPGCTEVVRWFVIQKVGTLSGAQLAALQSIAHVPRNNTKGLPVPLNNVRPFQALNGRTILAYPKLHALGTALDAYSVTAASVILGLSCLGIVVTIVAFAIITVRGHMA